MLGGMGNPKGALVGGILLGLIEALTAGYLSSVYKDAAAFIVILIVLFVMPHWHLRGQILHGSGVTHAPHPKSSRRC